ncbi:MAG TPA: hypothetical protein VFV01_38310 [Spirillospora sp.]|nr:hypothetical protein [Spirillospora sp.]
MQERSFRLPNELPAANQAVPIAPGLQRAAMEVSRRNPAGRGFDNRLTPDTERSALRGV